MRRGIWPATCGQSPAFLFRRYLPGAACREWPITGRHFTSTEPYPDGQPDGGATDPELMIGRSDHRLLFVEHQDVIELDTFRCGPFDFKVSVLPLLDTVRLPVWTTLPAFFNENWPCCCRPA